MYHKHYGIINWIGDSVLVILTCGLWGIKIFVREMRRR